MNNQHDLFSGFLENSSGKRTRIVSGDICISIRKKNGVGYLSFRKHFKESLKIQIKEVSFKFTDHTILMVLNPSPELKVPTFKTNKGSVIQNQILVTAFAEHFGMEVGDKLILDAKETVDSILGVQLFVLSKQVS